jgi:hypothetical protein
MPSLNEIYDEDDNLVTEFDFSSSKYSYNIIGVDAFRNVRNITKVTLNTAKWSTQSGIKIYSNIGGYGSLVDSGVNYNALFENCYNLTEVIINGDWMEEGLVPDRCFANANNLEKVQLVSGFEYIGEYAFYNNVITEIIMPDTIKSVAMKFVDKCDKLENIVFSKVITSLKGISTSKPMISNLVSLKSIALPYLIETLPTSFISGCPMLKEYVHPEGYASYGRNVDGMMMIILHSDKNEMESYLEQNPDFSQCNGFVTKNGIIYKSDFTSVVKAPYAIESVELPDTIIKIESYAFDNCANLTNIELPNNNITFGENVLSYTSIKEIIIPDLVESINGLSFRQISTLEKIVIGNSVKSIGTHAFSICPNVAEIIFKPSVAPRIVSNTWPKATTIVGSEKENKVAYLPYNSSGYSGGEWDNLFNGFDNIKPFEKKIIDISKVSRVYASAISITLYNNGEKFTAQEMYLIHTATGDKIVGIKNNDHYVLPELSKLYVGETYAVMISNDGLSYTFADLITMEQDKFNYEVDSVNGMNPYYESGAIMSMSLDDDMGVGVTASQTVSKYEYDVLAARIAYLESLLK